MKGMWTSFNTSSPFSVSDMYCTNRSSTPLSHTMPILRRTPEAGTVVGLVEQWPRNLSDQVCLWHCRKSCEQSQNNLQWIQWLVQWQKKLYPIPGIPLCRGIAMNNNFLQLWRYWSSDHAACSMATGTSTITTSRPSQSCTSSPALERHGDELRILSCCWIIESREMCCSWTRSEINLETRFFTSRGMRCQ